MPRAPRADPPPAGEGAPARVEGQHGHVVPARHGGVVVGADVEGERVAVEDREVRGGAGGQVER
ncbi:hypothetical protein ACFWE7_18695, partial [Isoptericola sp. NPDC060282]|uniref:hypothetical protein n=1 Tax=Isoptericola sp. NPDC060282 TaxID=3347093 RepID=UPI00365BDBE9